MKADGVEYLKRVDIVWTFHCGQFPTQEIKRLLDSVGVQLRLEKIDLLQH